MPTQTAIKTRPRATLFKNSLIVLAISTLLSVSPAHARTSADYLPADAALDASVPTPESVLGWEVGDWHVSHDKLLQYMRELAENSPRVSLTETGRTHEQRQLVLLAITSEENQGRLEELRQAHLEGNGPLVLWMGYSVHGNEPSGSNASLLMAYYLAASRSDKINDILDETIILVDPSVNPDGLQRYASWANQNAGVVPVTDPNTRQHNENWTSGRTNHYWFDLNRDWLPLVHPSSRARLEQYHRWLPHVLTDHHEQGRFAGFFFQPGVPERQNPLTPDENLELTRMLGGYHAAALDSAGHPYFTEDTYDDFYFGKGSTYPDINGSIGILFEQRAIRGQALKTTNGVETFRQAVDNQLRMSISTLDGSWENRDRLKGYQRDFHSNMVDRAGHRPFDGWVIGEDGDPARAAAFLDLLDRHRIEYRSLAQDLRAAGHNYKAGQAWVIPAEQRQFGLLEAMMEQRTQFQDNTFYDVSAWTLPLAYNLPYTPVSSLPPTTDRTPSSALPPGSDAAAWVIEWNQLNAAPWLQQLLEADVRVRTAVRPFSIQTSSGIKSFSVGDLIIQAGIQDSEVKDGLARLLGEAAIDGLRIHSLPNTNSVTGPDLGARHFRLVKAINPLVVGGKGTAAYDVGEIWHLLDNRLGIATTVVETQHFTNLDLWDYSHLLLADGSYSSFKDSTKSMIARWIKDGGVLVGISGGAGFAESLCFKSPADACKDEEDKSGENGNGEDTDGDTPPRSYADYPDDHAQQVIGGAIVSSVADLTHPLLFGYQRAELPLFRRGTTELIPSDNPYSTPVRYTDRPLMAGYIGEQRLEAMAGQPAVIAEKQGDGLVVKFANTPLFRGFWRGTERMFLNSLYFGQVVDKTEVPD